MTHLARTKIIRALNGEVFQLKPDPRVSSNIRNGHPVGTTLGYDIPPGWIIDPRERNAWDQANITLPSLRKPLKSANFGKKTSMRHIDTSHLSPEDYVKTLSDLSSEERAFYANYLRRSPRTGKGKKSKVHLRAKKKGTKKKGTKRR